MDARAALMAPTHSVKNNPSHACTIMDGLDGPLAPGCQSRIRGGHVASSALCLARACGSPVSLPQPDTMGNTTSSRATAPAQPAQVDEKAQVRDPLHQLEASLSRLQVAAPLSSSGQLTLDQMASWEDAAAGDAKVQLARTILSHSDVRSALMSRAAKIADQHVFNHVVDFKTGPVTDQKSSGRCWLFATTNVIRYNIMKKFKLKDFQLSQVRWFAPAVSFSANGATVLSILLG
jgi:hypothetical protein